MWDPHMEILGPLSGGSRNLVLEARLRGERVVARHSIREDAAIQWEIDLLRHLRDHGLAVPHFIPAASGPMLIQGWTMQKWVSGDPPSSACDWRTVAQFLRTLHRLTVPWTQRPTFRQARELLSADRGGDVALDLVPEPVVRLCRWCWSAVPAAETSVVHGDPGAGNIRMDQGIAVLLDWDEARVDHPLFDHAALLDVLPDIADPIDQSVVRRASLAWEIANGWTREPDYAAALVPKLTALVEPDVRRQLGMA